MLLLFFIFIALNAIPFTFSYNYIAGYEPVNDVTDRLLIDLDVRDIASELPGTNGGVLGDVTINTYSNNNGVINAKNIYINGDNSVKSSGTNRTIAGFSTSLATKRSGSNGTPYGVAAIDEVNIAKTISFWNNDNDWPNTIINDAFDGTSNNGKLDFATVGEDFRQQVINKGLVYFNTFNYIIWEMQDSINDCIENAINTATSDGTGSQAWDEAVAFYTGSAEGTSVGGIAGIDDDPDTYAYMSFMLAEKRCKNFDTCTADYDNNPASGYSQINKDVMDKFTAGKYYIASGQCTEAEKTKDEIVSLILVPLIQGTIRYLFKTKGASGNGINNLSNPPSSKEAGELFAFATAILPYVASADSNVASMLEKRAINFDYSTNTWSEIKTGLESTYPSIATGVTCASVGELTEAVAVGDTAGKACMEAGSDDDDSEDELEDWAIALIVISVLGATAGLTFGGFMWYKYKNAWLQLEDQRVMKGSGMSPL